MADWPPLFVDDSQVDPAHRELERAVMTLLLAGDDPVLDTLRAQFAASGVARRMFSGVGFVTDFAQPAEAPRVEAKALFFLSDVGADLNGRSDAAGFHVQVKSGRLKLLEGFAFADTWPSLLRDFKTYYRYPPAIAPNSPDKRCMDFVRQQWAKP